MERKLRIKNRTPLTLATADSTPGSIELIQLTRDIVQRSRFIAIAVAGICTLTIIALLMMPNRYTSEARMLPSGRSNGLASLRSMIGLSVNMMPADENSSALYPSILTSRTVQEAVLARPYRMNDGNGQVTTTLKEYFGVENSDLLRQSLDDCTDVTTSLTTGEITLQVTTLYPGLSHQICTEYVAQLEHFNRARRRSVAKENAIYLGSQLTSTSEELGAAEQKLRDYRSANRQWDMTSNPDVLLEMGRLNREVGLLTAKYRLLQEQHQMALLEAKKDVPIVQVLDPPSLPGFKSGPNRLTILVAVGLLSTFLAMICAGVAGSLSRRRHAGEMDGLADDLRTSLPAIAYARGRMSRFRKRFFRTGARSERSTMAAQDPDQQPADVEYK